MAIAEIGDQNVAPGAAEANWREGDSPRRVERAAGGDALYEVALGVEEVDEADACARGYEALRGVLFGVGHREIALDIVDAEGREARGDLRIGERARQLGVGRLKGGVEDIDFAGVDIGGVNKGAFVVLAKFDAGVDRAGLRVVDSRDGDGWRNRQIWGPGRDGALKRSHY